MVIAAIEAETLRSVVSTLIQEEVSLRWANLRGADLREADLSGADMSGADLSGADMSRANLHRADMSRANLSGANLSGADLSRADLNGADLSGADLSGADLIGADYYAVPQLHNKMLKAIQSGGSLDMSTWHRCETTHCRAGWAIVLAGNAGKLLESQVGSAVAGALIHQASCPWLKRVPDFCAANEIALEDIKRCAEHEKEIQP